MTRRDEASAPDPLEALWRRDRAPHSATVDDLRAELTRRRRRMLWVIVGELVLTLALVVVSVAVIAGEGPPSGQTLLGLGLLWLTWLVAAGFATWNRWGLRRASSESAEGYVALLEERTRRQRRVADFVLGLVAVQSAISVAVGGPHLAGSAVIALYAVWALWYRRRAGRELEAIRRIGSELRGDDAPV